MSRPPSRRPLLLLLDWDETISSHDTLSVISPPSRSDIFQSLSKAYLEDLASHDEAHPLPTRQTLEGQLAYLDSLDEVELKSQARVEESGLFVGVTREELRERARAVRLRDGWQQTSAWIRASGRAAVEHHVISVGWSATFIEEALRDAPPVSICANEVEVDEAGKGTGRLSKSRDAGGELPSKPTEAGRSGIRTGIHKRREMSRLVSSWRGSLPAPTDSPAPRPLVIYAGDSNTDLACLLEADVGLVLGEAKGLQKTLDRIGLLESRWLPFNGWAQEGGRLEGARGKLVHVRDWVNGLEVLRFMGEEQRAPLAN